MAWILFLLVAIPIIIATLSAIEFPAFAENIFTAFDAAIFYMAQGIDIMTMFLPFGLVVVCAVSSVGLRLIVLTYHLLMWVLRKIPVLGID